MSSCEMCGYVTEDLQKAIVEGTLLLLCGRCVTFGEVVELKQVPRGVVEKRLAETRVRRYPFVTFPETGEEDIVEDYAMRVKRARERSGKTQEEVAFALAEKGSVLQKVESGHMEPSLKLAKKLEQFFKIQLVKKVEDREKDVGAYQGTGSGMTLGDVVKLKK